MGWLWAINFLSCPYKKILSMLNSCAAGHKLQALLSNAFKFHTYQKVILFPHQLWLEPISEGFSIKTYPGRWRSVSEPLVHRLGPRTHPPPSALELHRSQGCGISMSNSSVSSAGHSGGENSPTTWESSMALSLLGRVRTESDRNSRQHFRESLN